MRFVATTPDKLHLVWEDGHLGGDLPALHRVALEVARNDGRPLGPPTAPVLGDPLADPMGALTMIHRAFPGAVFSGDVPQWPAPEFGVVDGTGPIGAYKDIVGPGALVVKAVGVRGPGSRGGKFYYDKTGEVRYGIPVVKMRSIMAARGDIPEWKRQRPYVKLLEHQLAAAIIAHSEHGVVKQNSAGGVRHLVVSPNLEPGDRADGYLWRATIFDTRGLSGHEIGHTPVEALREAAYGSDLSDLEAGTVAEFEAQQSTPEATEGNRRATLLKDSNWVRRHGTEQQNGAFQAALNDGNFAVAEAVVRAVGRHMQTDSAVVKALPERSLSWPSMRGGWWMITTAGCLHFMPAAALAKTEVQHPGSRGGQFHYAPSGKIVYGVLNRPIAYAQVPPGYIAVGEHPDFKHGTVEYKEPLSDHLVESYELEKIPTEADVTQLVERIATDMDYPAEWLDLYDEEPTAAAMSIGQLIDESHLHISREALMPLVAERVRSSRGAPRTSP